MRKKKGGIYFEVEFPDFIYAYLEGNLQGRFNVASKKMLIGKSIPVWIAYHATPAFVV